MRIARIDRNAAIAQAVIATNRWCIIAGIKQLNKRRVDTNQACITYIARIICIGII
jgi:hypothetical protein